MINHHALGGILVLLGLSACEKESPAIPSNTDIAAVPITPDPAAMPVVEVPVGEEFEIDVEEPAPEETTTPGEKLDNALQGIGRGLQKAGETIEREAAERTGNPP